MLLPKTMNNLIKTANTIPWPGSEISYWGDSIPKMLRAQADRDKFLRGEFEQEPPIEYKTMHYRNKTLFKITRETNPPQEGDISEDGQLVVGYTFKPVRNAPIVEIYWRLYDG